MAQFIDIVDQVIILDRIVQLGNSQEKMEYE